MLKYIATREGVDKQNDNTKATKNQNEFISLMSTKFSKCKQLDEYKDYAKYQTKSSASEFISAALENHPELFSDKTYLDYIATRPRVEKTESTHGLFSDKDTVINLESEAKALREHNGNIYSVIISLKREDAERLGFNNVQKWRDMLRSKIDEVSKQHNIPYTSLKWFGAFHNESHHPHVHLMLYSTNTSDQGYISKKGIDNLRKMFASEIFRDELINIYDEQTRYRDMLTDKSRNEFKSLTEKLCKNFYERDKISDMITELAKRLNQTKGKKVYGYLPKSLKRYVNEIIDEFEKDKDIGMLYNLWYKAKCDVYKTYTDELPIKESLSNEVAFKPIRNALIKAAVELGIHIKEDTIHKIQQKYIAQTIIRLGNSLSEIFNAEFDKQTEKISTSIDSKLKQEIEAKKKGQSITM